MQESNILYLLPPQKLPTTLAEIKGSSAYLKAFDILKSLNNVSQNQFADIQNAFTSYLHCFEVINNDPSESQPNKDNDEAFNIIRVNGDPMDVLLSSAINSFLHLVKDYHAGGSSLSDEEWEIVCLAYLTIFNLYLNSDNNLQWDLLEIVRPANLSYSKISSQRAYHRWVHGHYVFMTVIQAMIVNLNLFYTETEIDAYSSAKKYLQSATILMLAAKIALKFAGDFSNEAYLAGVRPTLMPPIAKPNLSGLYWRDHEFLIKQTLKKTNNLFKNPHPIIASAVIEFKEAMSQAYDAHKYVCQKFVGTEEHSLLTNKPAVEVLTLFKKSRLSYLNGDKKND